MQTSKHIRWYKKQIIVTKYIVHLLDKYNKTHKMNGTYYKKFISNSLNVISSQIDIYYTSIDKLRHTCKGGGMCSKLYLHILSILHVVRKSAAEKNIWT
jgi:hypothetical protein